VRLPTYSFEDRDLTGAIERLLADRALEQRIGQVSARLQAKPGTSAAADLLEAVALKPAMAG